MQRQESDVRRSFTSSGSFLICCRGRAPSIASTGSTGERTKVIWKGLKPVASWIAVR